MIEDVLKKHLPDLTAIRHDLHAHPEMLFQEERTAGIVADECRRLGFEVATGIAKTGVVASLRNGNSGRTIGIRADMDALPIQEQTNLPYASKYPGKMHACGHDGHTTMLLGLARYLAEHRNFDGTVRLIFQPSEEDEGGAFRMIEDGLFTRFPCDRVFALHNLPGEAEGQIVVRPGPITASCDVFTIVVQGVGGHGALPHKSVDPVVAASSIVLALQTVVSRNLDPHDPAVVTVGAINGGSMATVIPEEVRLLVGVRTVTKPVRDLVLTRIKELAMAHAKSYGCTADVQIGLDSWSYPAGFNTPDEAALVRAVALEMGQDPTKVDMRGPFMFSEDFSAMQEVVPSCYFGLGAGPGPMLHDPGYNFNDALLVKGPAFWARLVEKALPQA
ncbi:amidohydrolase [Aestuariivirga litoralis]|uniref:Amidohydrolase n=1 Tax=Aestuariivirga litoralis TaxID=2650924 RepID=A0A2W2BAB2_9HYPH|nr:M20 aminoacylase family protein [Aestuariivirga litoralis]PZF77018.1 amidohydrolase [Aestuariivirga litoralis]